MAQVFRSHKMNAFVGNITIGLGIGGSAHWWKNKHNQVFSSDLSHVSLSLSYYTAGGRMHVS